ncbi:MAG: exonuclease, partial [Betaproteobacteria bacterium]|nr:exonuclease [Betaproteobacteria bacterium]
MTEIFVSTDIEADGPIPGPHSMLSFASAAYRGDKTLIGTFEANLTTLPGAQGHPKTMEWWSTQPKAWTACRVNPRDPAVVMPEYLVWLKALPGKPVFVAYPAAFDFMFVHWYLNR